MSQDEISFFLKVIESLIRYDNYWDKRGIVSKSVFYYILSALILLVFYSNCSGYKSQNDSTIINTNSTLPPESPPTITTRKGIVYYDSFETPELVTWGVQTGNSTNISSIASAMARSGNSFLQIHIKKSDPWVAGGPRTEYSSPREMGYWQEGNEVWLGGSVFFSQNYVDDRAQEIFWQIHSSVDSDAVPFLIQSINENILIRGRGFSDVILAKTKNKWMDIVVHHKWSAANDGLTEVYINGQKVVNAVGVPTMLTGWQLYWKFGIYKSGWKNETVIVSDVDERTLYFDEMRIGDQSASYNDVKP